jgi:hypothetical protein
MRASMRTAQSASRLAVAFALLLASCSAPPVRASDITHYTGLTLCPGARVTDLTTPEERDTTPGFSFHVVLTLDRACEAQLIQQLAELSARDCSPAWTRKNGCVVLDASVGGRTRKHTSVGVTPLGSGRYDLRFRS